MLLNSFKNPYLNLGCGNKIHPDWINIDFASTNERVLKLDLLEKLPFETNSIMYIYNSHVLEHFSESDGIKFIKECYRLLKPDGILRIVVPDLENIINCYMNLIENRNIYNESDFYLFHRWIIIELFDQTVREYPGGLMKESFATQNTLFFEFITKRIGLVANSKEETVFRKKPFKIRIRQKLIKILLNDKEYKALKTGLFRNSGEIHKWMYDKYSLNKYLNEAGFKIIKVKNAYSSDIPSWSDYEFDIKNNVILNPTSLYIEATK